MAPNYREEILEVLGQAQELISKGSEEPENWSEGITALFILLGEVCSYRMTPQEFIGGMELAKHALLKDHMEVDPEG